MPAKLRINVPLARSSGCGETTTKIANPIDTHGNSDLAHSRTDRGVNFNLTIGASPYVHVVTPSDRC